MICESIFMIIKLGVVKVFNKFIGTGLSHNAYKQQIPKFDL